MSTRRQSRLILIALLILLLLIPAALYFVSSTPSAVPPVSRTNSNSSKELGPITATASGVTVQFLSIARNLSDDSDLCKECHTPHLKDKSTDWVFPVKRQWWYPNGSLLKQTDHPYQEIGFIGPSQRGLAHLKGVGMPWIFDLAIRLDNPRANDPDGPTLQWDTTPISGFAFSQPLTTDFKLIPNLLVPIVIPPQDAKALTLRLLLADGAWNPPINVATGPNFAAPPSRSTTLPTNPYSPENFVLSADTFNPHPDGITFICAETLTPPDFAWRVLAIDSTNKPTPGRLIVAPRKSGGFVPRWQFDFPLTQIKSLQIQTRPFTKAIEFRNLCLDPSHPTKPQVVTGASLAINSNARAMATAKSPAMRASANATIRYVHKPFAERKCNDCHETQEKLSTRVRVKADVCTTACHASLKTKYRVTHGPFANNACSMCHDPHQSSNAHLLRSDTSRLCTHCHEPKTLKTKPAEHLDAKSNCMTCHSGHGGSDRNLLLAQNPTTNPAALSTTPQARR